MSKMPCPSRIAHSFALGAGLLLLQAGPALAQSAAPDFGRGFQHFQALGLPALTNATYVRLDKDAARSMGSGRMHSGESAAPGSDGAWLIKRISDDEAEFLTSAQHRLTIVSPQKLKAEWQEKMEAARQAAMDSNRGGSMNVVMHPYNQQGPKGHPRIAGSWTQADPVEDGRALIAYIEKLMPGDDDDYDENPLQRAAGEMLLTAATLHGRGATAEANRLAQLLFEKAGGQQAVIAQALSLLADAQYTDLYLAFRRTRDWEAYRAGMTALTARFARGWQRRDAVLRVIPTVKSRTAGPAPVPAGDGLGEEDLALAAALAAPRADGDATPPALREYDSALWILPTPTREGSADKPADAIAQIKQRGLQSIPLLLALLSDSYPTAYDNPAGSIPMRNDTFRFRSSGPMPPQMVARIAKQRSDAFHASLPRPMTRGEIAAALLRQVVTLPNEMRYGWNTDSNVDPTQVLRTAAEQWYAANKDLKPTDIALGYLRAENDSGHNPHRQTALRYLVQHGREDAVAEIEKVLLAMAPTQAASMAMAYADQRGDEARPFITAFIKRLKAPEETQQDDNDGLYLQQSSAQFGGNADWTKRMIKQFEALLAAEPLETLLAAVNAGERQFREQHQILVKAAAKETPEKATGLLLAATINAPDIQTASQMMGLVASLPYARMSTSHNRRGGAAEPALEMPAPSVHRELWRQLLDDKRPVPTHGQMGKTTTLGEQTAWVLEMFNIDVSAMMVEHGNMQRYAMLPEAQMTPLLFRRAHMRIEGEPAEKLPPLPDADNVTADDLQALIANLIATAPEALAERIAALSLDEQMAMIQETANNQPLREALAPLANRISLVEIKVDAPVIQTNLQALAQQPVSKALVEQLFAAVQSIATNSQRSVIGMLLRQAPADGITLSLRTAGKDDDAMLNMYSYGMRGQRSTPVITGMYSDGNANGYGRWKVELPKPPEAEAKPTSPDATRKQRIMEIIKSGAENLTPELIAELESMGGDDVGDMEMYNNDDMYASQNEQFWKAIETIGAPETYAAPLYLVFTYAHPEEKATEDEAADGVMMDEIIVGD